MLGALSCIDFTFLHIHCGGLRINKLLSLIGAAILAVAIILLGLLGAGCGSHGHRGTAIPGSGDVCITGRGFFVSPDEQWLVLITREAGGRAAGLCSLNIATMGRTDYDPEQFPEKFKRYLDKGVMSFTGFNQGLDPEGWFNGRFFLGIGMDRLALSLLPSQPDVVEDHLPHESLMLSDGPDAALRTQVIRGRLNELSLTNLLNQFLDQDAIVWRHGEWGNALYHYDTQEGEIRQYRPGQPARTLVRVNDGFLKRSYMMTMRVSPDERYLAYAVTSVHKYIVTPYYKTVLKVMELRTGKSREIAQLRHIARPYWSGDSQRLYYSGKEGDLSGVWVVDMKEVFGG